jgi:hypothetical protein
MTSVLHKLRIGEIGHWEFQADSGDSYWSDAVYRIHGLPVGGKIDVQAATIRMIVTRSLNTCAVYWKKNKNTNLN